MHESSRRHCLCLGCGGHRPRFHCLHRGHVSPAGQPLLVGALLPHAAQLRPQHHVWHYGGHPRPAHRPLQNSGQQQDQSHKWAPVASTAVSLASVIGSNGLDWSILTSLLRFASICCSSQLHHRLSDWPSLHAALWELLCDDVRRLLCHPAAHHRGGVRDVQRVVAVWSWQVGLICSLWGNLKSQISTPAPPPPHLFWQINSISLVFVSEDSLMTSRRCWAGVPASFTSTCGSTSASLPCWGCWQPPPSKCSSNTPLIWRGTKRRYGDLSWNGAYQYILMFYCRNITPRFDWLIALDMLFLVKFVQYRWGCKKNLEQEPVDSSSQKTCCYLHWGSCYWNTFPVPFSTWKKNCFGD